MEIASKTRACIGKVAEYVDEVLSLDPLLTSARLTLLLLALYSGRYWDVKVPLAMFSVLGILSKRFALNPLYWCAISVVIITGNVSRLFYIDNHNILMAYWCVALLAAVSTRKSPVLRANARLLIGGCFLFAVLWKCITADFANGAFMHYTLLLDGRFAGFSNMICGVTDEMRLHNMLQVQNLVAGKADEALLSNNGTVESVAYAISLHTIGIESMIAIMFLGASFSNHLRRWRNIPLFLFLGTTYAIATVIGFGWLVAIMGYAQCGSSEKAAKLTYLAIFVLLQIFLIPWAQIGEDLFGLHRSY